MIQPAQLHLRKAGPGSAVVFSCGLPDGPYTRPQGGTGFDRTFLGPHVAMPTVRRCIVQPARLTPEDGPGQVRQSCGLPNGPYTRPSRGEPGPFIIHPLAPHVACQDR